MTSALIIPVHRGAIGAMMPPRHGGRRENAPKSTCHKLVLALVWLTMAISGIVFSEPAPVDLLLAGLLLLLPLVGMTRFPPLLAYGWAIVLIIAAATVLAVPNADDMARAITHGSVTLYLYGAGFVIAGFVAYAPAAHSRLILHAYLAGAVAAALAGIIGYLDLVPGAYDLFTRFSRAAGPFKDPNVYAPYLICPLLTALHIWLTRPLVRGAPYLVAATILAVAILFSFSRGAWAATLLALAIYCYFYMLSASRNFDRLKLAALVLFGTTTVALVLVAALQSDRIALLLQDRFAVTQPYDEGPNGRFGGQMTAIDLILDSPLGIGPNQFAPRFHHEEAHNVYLSTTLNAGWTGGLLYLALCVVTVVAGLRHVRKDTATRAIFIVAFSALVAHIALGALIDTDHWRHFYVLMGVVWGLMAGDPRAVRRARIVTDSRPVLLKRVLIIPPTKRPVRILAEAIPQIAHAAPRTAIARIDTARSRERRRRPRIRADVR